MRGNGNPADDPNMRHQSVLVQRNMIGMFESTGQSLFRLWGDFVVLALITIIPSQATFNHFPLALSPDSAIFPNVTSD